ncbi:MAG: periplasmic thiol:disulfide interchange protein DsbA [Marine Group I thaumarchaeote]|nr:MAG: periplasmic thiol:disulfide interchange protein DsbA [Marine Group I thaumarchaeote]
MRNYYLLAIPAIIGIFVGAYLGIAENDKVENNETLLTAQKLVRNGSPIVGNPNAPITILEWGDFQCTFCYRFHESSLDIIQREYIETGIANLVFKDFPLNGPDSVLAAEAAYCAEDQGKYWSYHDELYANWAGEKTGWITDDSLNQFAITSNLDIEKFNSCLADHKYRQRVLDLEQFGREIGIDATPSFLIFNDEKIIKIRGNQPIDVFRKVIDELSNTTA